MKEQLAGVVQAVVKELFSVDMSVELTRPDEQFGDYATNVALQLVAKMANPPAGGPREVAEAIATTVQGRSLYISEVRAAGPGFINLALTDKALSSLAQQLPS